MPTELKDIKVDFLSLVAKGANGKKIIYKSDGNRPQGAENIELVAKNFIKSDDRQMVYSVVYSPDEVDSQKEFAKAEEIEAAAYQFMKSRNVLNVDANHDFDPKAAYVAESWILKGVDTLFPKEREGAWAVGIKVEDPELWARVKKGELEGISMAGCAVKVRKDEGGGILGKLEDMLGRLLKSEPPKQEESVAKTDDKAVDEFLAKVVKAVKDDAMGEVTKTLGELSTRIEAIEKSTSGKQSSSLDGTNGSHESCVIA